MKVALAQMNSALGDFSRNQAEILQQCRKAHSQGADVIVFPEMSLYGYPPTDLLERQQTVSDQLACFQKIPSKIPPDLLVILGLVTLNSGPGKPFFNSAAVFQKDKKPKFFHKSLLPAYDIFDEGRHFHIGNIQKNVMKFKGRRLLVTVCEDIWAWEKEARLHASNPLKEMSAKDVDLIFNLSASPFSLGKDHLRLEMAKKTSQHFKAPLIYVNTVGAQDEVIFDGASFVLNSKGEKVLQLSSFSEELEVWDEEDTKKLSTPSKKPDAEVLRQALLLGLREFCDHNGFKQVHLGLSGGVDSAVVACLAAEALGPDKVHALAMPGPHSKDLSLELAQGLAKTLGISLDVLPIGSTYDHVVQQLDTAWGASEFSVMHENLQARLRALFLMAYSNKAGSLLLNTSNKSEFASGYSTLYGDMCGGLAPLGDLLKHQVFALAELYSERGGKSLERIAGRAPSAELRPNQKDQDSLPPYPELDKAVNKVIENKGPVRSASEKWLAQALLRSEFKRWQAPPILRVSAHAFGRGRRWPISTGVKRI